MEVVDTRDVATEEETEKERTNSLDLHKSMTRMSPQQKNLHHEVQ